MLDGINPIRDENQGNDFSSTGGNQVTIRTLRASAMDRLIACLASGIPPEIPIEFRTEPSAIGTVGHRCIAPFIMGQPFDLEEICSQHGVEPEDGRRVFGGLVQRWEAVERFFPQPVVEMASAWVDPETKITVTGHMDVFSKVYVEDEKHGMIGDFKTGFSGRAAEYQLKTYALIAAETMNLTKVNCLQINSRQRESQGWEWTRRELRQWWESLAHRLVTENLSPVAGSHCQYCPRWGECPAGRQYVRQCAEALLQLNGAPMTHDETIEVYEKIKLVTSRCEQLRDFIRNDVASCGGKIVHRDGRRSLELVEVTKREISFEEAKPVLCEIEGWEQGIVVRKTMIESIVKDNVPSDSPRGSKGKAITDFYERLDAAGAVSVVPEFRLELHTEK
jgi:hypothetical protein